MKNHGGAVQDNAETLFEVPILCDHNSPNLILSPQNFVVYILQTTINVFTKNKNLHPCIPIQM